MSPDIRRAIPTDVHRLMDMGRAFFEEAGWAKHAEYDPTSFAYSCGLLMDHGVFLVADDERAGVIGMVAAGICPAYWNRKVLTSSELFWYCMPGYRQGVGAQLMSALEADLKARGVFLASMSAEEGMRGSALGRLYRQRGYFPMEKLYWRVLAA